MEKKHADTEIETVDDKITKRRQHAFRDISSGAVACLAWGAVWFLFWHSQWVLVPAFFMGALPIISGIRELFAVGITAPATRRKSREDQKRQLEQRILRLASEREGTLTPALVSMETGLSLDEAQAALDEMAGKGHAELNVLESGRLEYRFPELER